MKPGSLVLLAWLRPVAAQWTKPNAAIPGFTDTYTVGETIFLSWLYLNDSINDLWLTRYDTTVDSFSLRLTVSRNVSGPDSYEWPIAIDRDIVHIDTRFVLQFLPVGSNYDSFAPRQLASPAFNLILVNQKTPANGTVGSDNTTVAVIHSPTSTIALTATSTSRASSNGSTQGPDNRIGIGIGVAGVAVIAVCMLLAALLVRRRRKNRKTKLQTEKVDGPYEILGDKRMPTELSSHGTSISELSGGKETSVSEACSSPIHEMSTIIKKPGLHEMPG